MNSFAGTARVAGLATLAAMVCAGAASAADYTIKLTGTAIIDLQNFAQADGSTSQQFHSRFVQTNTADSDMPGETMTGDCYGAGIVTPAGEYGGSYRCSIFVSADDAIVIHVNDTSAGGPVAVIGGKGKFAGATGDGTITYTWGDSVFGDRLLYSEEIKFSTP